MGDSPDSREALPLLGEVYRLRQTGVFNLELEEPPLGLLIREGEVKGFLSPPRDDDAPAEQEAEPPEAAKPEEPLPGPSDTAKLKLDQVLAEVGLGRIRGPRRKKSTAPKVTRTSTDVGELRDRLVAALADEGTTATFEATEEPQKDVVPAASPVEPMILETLRRLDQDRVRKILGDLDHRLVATAALAEQQRTLTLNEGYLLSRVDGQCSAREILQLVPGKPTDAELTLAGLLLTGRVALQPPPTPKARAPKAIPTAETPPSPREEPAPDAQTDDSQETPTSPKTSTDEASPEAPAEEAAADVAATPEQTAERNEILELFQSLPLKNHYDIMGVERSCSEAELKAAQVALVKRYHPDMRREPYLEDLHDVLEAIFIRVSEAWEVLGNAKSRAAYEQELGRAPKTGAKGSSADEDEDDGRPSTDEILRQAQYLVGKESYGDAIAMLERALPHIESQEERHAVHIIQARAYSLLAGGYEPAEAKKWVNRAMEILQGVLAQGGKNANASYELGMVYKRHGMTARAQTMFKKALEANPSHKRATAELAAQREGKEPEQEGGLLRRLFRGGN